MGMEKIMVESSTKIAFILLVTFAITIPCLEAAHVLSPAEFDDVVKARAEEAHKVALDTYVPIPEGVAHDLNVAVHMSMEAAENNTRRDLRQKGKKHDGPCEATNPIDSCWRCKADWAANRFQLAKCSKGFGRKTTGGLGGPIYVVADESDNDMVNPKPGTLRFGAVQK